SSWTPTESSASGASASTAASAPPASTTPASAAGASASTASTSGAADGSTTGPYLWDRSMTSRARLRYCSAAGVFGAHDVMGSPATDVSGKRTVRVMTVSKTVSPNT